MIVTLLTDYGRDDDFVGVCHGVIRSIEPDARIVDITHGIPRYGVRQGAIVLRNTLPYMPVGVHMAVVDPQTRAIGLGGLRVVDSSILPSITTGNLNAPTIMVAEKAADHILGRPLAAASDAPYYVAENWRTAQR